tara:strand:- start:609 stop:791 length:183 start_codon:yes stop_codon:yes gene_type:complete
MKYIYNDYDDTIYKVKMSQVQFNASRLCYYMEETSVSGEVTVTPMMSDTDVGFAIEVEIE